MPAHAGNPPPDRRARAGPNETWCLPNQHQPGCLLDTPAVLDALQSGHLGALGIDVYEQEDDFFFADWSGMDLPDTDLNTLTHLPNVVVTSHQSFFTREAIEQIARTTLNNLTYPDHE